MLRKARRAVVVAALGLTLLTGCGQDDTGLSPDADYYAGLDPKVVAEYVANPVVQQKLAQDTPEERPSLAQGGAINFIVCRDSLRVYQEWLRNGKPPALAPLPKPDHPQPSYDYWKDDYARLQALVASGDPEQLRDKWLTGDGSCGQWIPAQPGHPRGPTIEDVVLGRS